MRWLLLAVCAAGLNVILSSLPCASQSQSSAGLKVPARSDSLPKKTPAAKLTTDEERGLRLLKQAESEAPGLEASMRAFVLLRASYAYARIDQKKAEKLAKDSFEASASIEDPPDKDQCGPIGSAGDIKSWIQKRVLSNMIQKQKVAEAEQLLPSATPPVRDHITKELLYHYIEKKQFDHAEALLAQVANDDEYPFDGAATLFNALPKQKSPERMAIFNQALNNFEQYSKNERIGQNDFGNFIESTATYANPEAVLEAIDKVLDTAKAQDSPVHYSMASSSGTLQLNSIYQFRLFQLLPVLQELDKDKAESLLRDDLALQEQLKKYPEGMDSLMSSGNVYSYGITDDNSPKSAEAAQSLEIGAQISDRLNQISKETETEPDQALSDALNMPLSDNQGASPRAEALQEVAQALVKKKPRIAESALDQLWKIEDQWSGQQSLTFEGLPQLYLDLGDEEGANKALQAMLNAAERLYARDINSDDPNKAFKGTWPSADLWTKCVQIAAKLSPALAEEIIAEIPDPDIAASVNVVFAGALLGQSSGAPFLVSDCRKSGSGYRFSN